MSIPYRRRCLYSSASQTAMKKSAIRRLGISLVLTLFSLYTPTLLSAAGALDWLVSKQPQSKTTNAVVNREVAIAQPQNGAMPEFFASEAQPDTTGQNLNLLKFVEVHWTNSGKNLSAVTKELAVKIAAKKCSDIVTKLMTVDLQSYKESVKSGASGIDRLRQGNGALDRQLVELNRIITAPREETMASLEKTLEDVDKVNKNQSQVARTYLAAAEKLITIGQESYQTLELIPTLSIAPIDIYVQASKALMKQVQSSSEAMKGLLLNIQNSCEQVGAGVELMRATIKTTLRFSDHFAFAQYPLINLPVPAREKLFSQLSALRNTAKGIDNTLSIGDSHVKNSAQQYAHLCEALTVKIRDSLKYLNQMDIDNGQLNQLAGYTQNQVSGLYQRLKESLAEMKVAMAKAGRANGESAPKIAMESPTQGAGRRASAASAEKLPLFLLGGGTKNSEQALAPMPLEQISGSGSGQTAILYQESDDFSKVVSGKQNMKPFKTDSGNFNIAEMRILRKELGPEALGAADIENLPLDASSDPSTNAMLSPYSSGNFGFDDSYAGEGRDLELMRMDVSNITSDASDLIPMLRLDEMNSKSEE